MFIRANNKCSWIYTRLDGPKICNKPCTSEMCSKHTQQKRRNNSQLAVLCIKCGTNGTRSLTNICLGCGSHKIIANICAKAYYYRKKLENQLQMESTTVEC